MSKTTIEIKDKNTGTIIETSLDLNINNLENNQILYSNDDFEIKYPKQAKDEYVGDLNEYNDGKKITINTPDDWQKYTHIYSYACYVLNNNEYINLKRKADEKDIFTLYGTNTDFSPLEIIRNNGFYFLATEKLTGYDSSEYFFAKVNTVKEIFDYLTKIQYGTFSSTNVDNIFDTNENKPNINDIDDNSVFTGNYFLSYQNADYTNKITDNGAQGLKSIYEEIKNSGAMDSVSGNSFNISLGNYTLNSGYFKSQGFDRAGDHINGSMVINKKELFDEIIESIPSSTLKI